MNIIFDAAKDEANQAKHGVSLAESLRVFRSCPLITPKDAQSSLQMRAIARYGYALRLDRTPFERAARSRPKNSQALKPPRLSGRRCGCAPMIGAATARPG